MMAVVGDGQGGLMLPRADDGTTNEPLSSQNMAHHMAIAAFTGIAWYNVLELNVSVYMIFKRKQGLYFWSVLLAIQGIWMHSLAFILKLYGVVSVYQFTVSLITVGWYCMVTGQSMVLYSRLHLVVSEKRIVQFVLCMIIFNAVTLHIPTTVLTFGSNSPDYALFRRGYRLMENIQMTIFCVQELIISGIYIWATLRFLRPFYKLQIRSVMIQLFWINVAIIVMDIAMLSVQYIGLYSMEVAMKGAIYSVKLKIEFAVLNQLMRIAKASRENRSSGREADRRRDGSRDFYHDKHKATGFWGFIRQVLPGPTSYSDDHADDDCDGHYIGGGDILTDHSERRAARANGNMSVVSAMRRNSNRNTGNDSDDDDDEDDNDPRSRIPGISVTREVMQVSKRIDCEEVRNQGKPTSYYPGSGNDSRATSMDSVHDGIHSDGSHLELMELASSPCASGFSVNRTPPVDSYNARAVDTTTLPRRTARPPWKSRSSVMIRTPEPDEKQRRKH